MRRGGASNSQDPKLVSYDQARQLTSYSCLGTVWKLLRTLVVPGERKSGFGDADSARERPNVAAGGWCCIFLFALICDSGAHGASRDLEAKFFPRRRQSTFPCLARVSLREKIPRTLPLSGIATSHGTLQLAIARRRRPWTTLRTSQRLLPPRTNSTVTLTSHG